MARDDLKPGDRVEVTGHHGGTGYFDGRTGELIKLIPRTWSGYGGYWSVALDDGWRYDLYEDEITKIEEEANG